MRTILTLVVCLGGFGRGAFGEALPVDLADGLSEEEAVWLALSASPDLQALREGRKAARLQVSRTAILARPEVRLGSSETLGDLDSLGLRRHKRRAALVSPADWRGGTRQSRGGGESR